MLGCLFWACNKAHETILVAPWTSGSKENKVLQTAPEWRIPDLAFWTNYFEKECSTSRRRRETSESQTRTAEIEFLLNGAGAPVTVSYIGILRNLSVVTGGVGGPIISSQTTLYTSSSISFFVPEVLASFFFACKLRCWHYFLCFRSFIFSTWYIAVSCQASQLVTVCSSFVIFMGEIARLFIYSVKQCFKIPQKCYKFYVLDTRIYPTYCEPPQWI